MDSPRILLVEEAGVDSLGTVLVKEGYQVHVVHTARNAAEWARSNQPDLVIFDGASMQSTGVSGCRELRKHVGDAPIIHTRGQGVSQDESAQADVYLVQPFTARKILNRVRSLLPADQYSQIIVRAGDLTLFRNKPSVEVEELGEKALTPKQAHLLEEFLRYPNQTLDRRQLMRHVWDTDYIGDTRTLDVHIRWLREAIETNPSRPRRIITVRGVGYVFRLPPVAK